MNYKIGVLSLGCPRNLVDTESILGRLNLKGHRIVDIAKADVALVNTCAFIEDAKRESIDAILDLAELKKKGSLKKIIVYGCLAQRYGGALRKEFPEVDAFVGSLSLNHELKRFALTPSHFAYLKIAEGCVNNCSFCVIPKIKGKFVSLDEASIMNKVGSFDKAGASEINIIGQDISGYGLDLTGGLELAGLLKKITNRIKNAGWLRLLYLNPNRITDELLRVIRDEPVICKYIDLPIQHVNDRILKLMSRSSNKTDILRLIEKIRKTIPDVALRTSVIVGFPSETDKEFNELLGFIEEMRFERLGAFIYSREEGTRAAGFKKQVSGKMKTERFNKIMAAQQIIARDINRKLLGKEISVLIDERQKDYCLGRTQHDAPEVDGQVFVYSAKKLNPGDFVKVKITDTLEYDLVGEACP